MNIDKDEAKDTNASPTPAEPIKAEQAEELTDAALEDVAGGRSITPMGEWHRKPIEKV